MASISAERNSKMPHRCSGFARLQPSENVINGRNVRARPDAITHQIPPNARQLVQAVVIGLASLQMRVHGFEQTARFPRFQRRGRIIVARQRATVHRPRLPLSRFSCSPRSMASSNHSCVRDSILNPMRAQ